MRPDREAEGHDERPRGHDPAGSDGCSDATYTEIAGTSADGVFLSGPDLTAFSGGAFYKDEFVPAYEEAYGSRPDCRSSTPTRSTR